MNEFYIIREELSPYQIELYIFCFLEIHIISNDDGSSTVFENNTKSFYLFSYQFSIFALKRIKFEMKKVNQSKVEQNKLKP